MPAKLAIRSRTDAAHLMKAASAIEQAAWSNLGYRAHSDYPIAVASSVPFACSGPDDLPPEGWDWLVETAARTKNTRDRPLRALDGGG
jgi:hypothetical protein